MNNEKISKILNRAKDYPYQRPNGSFLLESDRIVELKGRVLDGDLAKFIPVLAYGSNASPEQLRRKLNPIKEPIAVLSSTLRDIDVVFSGQFSRYGCIPATLARSKGTMLYTHVVLLTKKQLSLIHKTELPEYRYGELQQPIIIDRLGFRESIKAYIFDWGFVKDKKYIAFEEVFAEKRNYLSLNHPECLSLAINEITDKQISVDDFIVRLLDDKNKLIEFRNLMKKNSKKISLDNFKQELPKQ